MKQRWRLLGSYSTTSSHLDVRRKSGKSLWSPKKWDESLSLCRKAEFIPDQTRVSWIREITVQVRPHVPLASDNFMPAWNLSNHTSRFHYYTAQKCLQTALSTCTYSIWHVAMRILACTSFDILDQRGLEHNQVCHSEIIYWRNQGVKVDIRQVEQVQKRPKIKHTKGRAYDRGNSMVEIRPPMRIAYGPTGWEADEYLELVAAKFIHSSRSSADREVNARIHTPRTFRSKKGEKCSSRDGEISGDLGGIMVYQKNVIKVAHHFRWIEPSVTAWLSCVGDKWSGKYPLHRMKFDRVGGIVVCSNAKEKGHTGLNWLPEVWSASKLGRLLPFHKGTIRPLLR